MSRFISKRRTAGLVAIMVACIAGASAYAFTAANTGLAAHKAGATQVNVTGYAVTALNYTFSADGTTVQKATFQLDAAATDVKVALTAAAPTVADWYDCGATVALTDLVCTFTVPIPNGAADKLSILAVNTGQVVIGT